MIDKNMKRICNLLKNSKDLTISDIVSKIKLSRATTRIALAKLEGAGKIDFKKIGMAKIYFLKGGRTARCTPNCGVRGQNEKVKR